MRYGSTVRQLQPSQDGVVVNRSASTPPCWPCRPPSPRACWTRRCEAGAGGLLDALKSFDYLPIATLNLRLAGPWRLPEPMMMLREDPARGHLGQWLFDRARGR